MAKTQRALWELNNKYREFWGQPLLPEPEDGFAYEEYPPGFLEVVGWFRDALPKRYRALPVPVPEIRRIARLVSELQLTVKDHDPLREVISCRVLELQRVLAQLEAALPPVIDLLLDGAVPADPTVTRLIDLHNAAWLAQPYIGPPSKQGRTADWHLLVHALAEPIRLALETSGAPTSIKPDGPMVRVLCCAIAMIGGVERTPEAVEKALKRRRRSRDKKI